MQLQERLQQRGLLSADDLKRLSEAQAAAPDRPLHQLILERTTVPENTLLELLGDEFGLEVVDLSTRKVPQEVIQAVPSRLVHRRNIIPLERQNGTLIVATSDPNDLNQLDEL